MQHVPLSRQRAWLSAWWSRHTHGSGFHWRTRAQDRSRTIRRYTQGFVLASYATGAAWSLTMFLAGMNIKALLFAFHFSWIGTVALLLLYRSHDPVRFRTLLNPKIWTILMLISTAVTFESLTNGYDNAAVLSGVIGTAGALAPLAVKALLDIRLDRLKRRAAAASQTPPPK